MSKQKGAQHHHPTTIVTTEERGTTDPRPHTPDFLDPSTAAWGLERPETKAGRKVARNKPNEKQVTHLS